jgi:hypothetical protein
VNRLLIGIGDKNALLLSLMQEDFDDGLLLIDTTGELAEAAADRMPKLFTERTFYFEPADTRHVAVLNVLDRVPESDRHRVAKEVCAFFDLIFPEGPSTLTRARTNYLLLNCLRLLMDSKTPSLADIPRLLSDKAYRTRLLKQTVDPVLDDFWRTEFESWKPEDTLPLKSKVGELLLSPLIRSILGGMRSTFSLERGHIVLANLDRRLLGDQTAFLLGSLLLTRSTGAVYISDLGFFGTDYLAGKLSEGRFTLSGRFLDELPDRLQQAILGIDEKYVVRTNRADAERLAFYVGAQNPSVLMDLRPAEAKTPEALLEITPTESLDRLKAVRRRSRACHTRKRTNF